MSNHQDPRHDVKALFLAALEETLSVRHAARAAGISRQTAYNWKNADPTFSAAWEEQRENAIDQ